MADNAPKFELEIADVPREALSFLSFRAEEQLFECYRVDVTVLSARVDPEQLLGKLATLYVRFEECPERTFHGVVWSAELTPLDDRVCELQVQIVPRLLQLSLGQSSRVFTDKTIQDVVKTLLEQGGLKQDDDFDLHFEPGPAHPMIVQRNESDYDFLRRLLHEEGIGFLIQNEPDAERVVFFEDPSALLPIDGLSALVDRRRKDLRSDTVFGLRETHSVTPDGVMLRDYDPRNPSRSPDAIVPQGEAPSREVYDHPGGHLQLDTRAQRRLESLSLLGRRFDGGGYWPHLEPGRYVPLESDLRGALGCEIVLLSVTHVGHLHDVSTPAAYENHFVALPKASPYRPQRASVAPRPAGPERAFVTGPRGQELHGDDLGRVKVRFPWDRSGITDDKSSSFVRVGQPQLTGSMIIPRVGFEVVLGHELGDIDRPYVSGHLFSEETAPPYASDRLTTSSLQSATTDGGARANELRFSDSAGAEEVLINASYDLQLKVENTAITNIGKNEQVDIGGNAQRSVTANATGSVGADQSLHVGAMQTVNVGGNSNEGVGGNQEVSIGAARMATVGGDHVEEVAGDLTRTVSAMQTVLVVSGATRRVGGDSQVQVGAAWAETVAKSKSTTVAGARVEDVAALKLVSAKTVGISTDAAYAEKVESQEVKTAKDRSDSAGDALSLEAKSSIRVDADNITFTASDELTLSAGKVTLTLKKSGEVSIKAKEITIKNAKALKQITHKTN